MLRPVKQQTLSFHAELYDLIPQPHLLVSIQKHVDFAFIHELVRSSYCEYYGRPANEPELLFRLLFLQTLYSLSDERVVQEAQVNLAYKWFLGLNPEDSLPDSSQLSRFGNHRLGAGAVDKGLQVIVNQCIKKGLIQSKTMIVDATHTVAATRKQGPLRILRDAAKRLFHAALKKDPTLKNQIPKLPPWNPEQEDAEKRMLRYVAELGEKVERLVPHPNDSLIEKIQIAKAIVQDERLLAHKGIQSAIDPDARLGWKNSTTSFLGYKEPIARTEEEIITAVTVTGGNSDDGKQLPSLLEQTVEAGVSVQEVIGDTAYSSKENLLQMRSSAIQAVIPLNPIVHQGNQKQEGFTYHKDAHVVICPAGERSVRQKRNQSKTRKKRDSLSFYFNIKTGRTCPLQEGCLRPGAKSKTYSVRIIADDLQEQIDFEHSHTFKKRIRRRPIIEHKNAELKRFHGLSRAKYRGLFRMRIQAIVTAFAVNAKRMIKLIKPMQPVS